MLLDGDVRDKKVTSPMKAITNVLDPKISMVPSEIQKHLPEGNEGSNSKGKEGPGVAICASQANTSASQLPIQTQQAHEGNVNRSMHAMIVDQATGKKGKKQGGEEGSTRKVRIVRRSSRAKPDIQGGEGVLKGGKKEERGD